MVLGWSRERPIRNSAQLVENVRLRGGAIIQYERLESVLIACERSARFEWVGQGESRRMAGLKHALYCAMLGWWSAPGFLSTPVCIVANLMGGLDVTERFVEPDGVLVKEGVTKAEEEQQSRRDKLVWLATLAAVIGLCVYFAVQDVKAK